MENAVKENINCMRGHKKSWGERLGGAWKHYSAPSCPPLGGSDVGAEEEIRSLANHAWDTLIFSLGGSVDLSWVFSHIWGSVGCGWS